MNKNLEKVVRETPKEFDTSVDAAARKFGVDSLKKQQVECYQGYALWQ